MLTVDFAGYSKAEVIVWEHKMDNARGIIECTVCKKKSTLYADKKKGIADEIEFFIKNHNCTK